MDLALTTLLILDVDGVLTDGRLTYMRAGADNPKTFFVQDGYAIKLWQRCGGGVAIISGRESRPVSRRAKELGIEHVHLGVHDKIRAYEEVLAAVGCSDEAVAYVGDDLPDLAPMRRCGFAVAVANAVGEVKRVADYITRRPGGAGAVAEVIELLLRKQGKWSQAVADGA